MQAYYQFFKSKIGEKAMLNYLMLFLHTFAIIVVLVESAFK